MISTLLLLTCFGAMILLVNLWMFSTLKDFIRWRDWTGISVGVLLILAIDSFIAALLFSGVGM